MSKPRNSSLLVGRSGKGSSSISKLEEKPEDNDEESRQLDNLNEKEDGDNGDNPCTGEKHEIGSENAGNSSTCSNGRESGIEVYEKVSESSSSTTEKVKEEESEVPQVILYVVSKYPEIKHISKEVKRSSVDKH